MTAQRSTFAFVVGVAFLAALDLQVGLRPGLEPITSQEMSAGVARLEALRGQGDVLVHSPLFGVEELKALGALRARPDVPGPRVLQSRRVLVLDRVDAPMRIPTEPESVEPVTEHLEVRVYAPAGDSPAVVYELLTDLTQESMRVERPEGRISSRCRRRRAEGGFSCPNEAEWLYAAARTLRVGGEQATCVWAHPTTGGAIIFTLPAPAAPVPGRDLVLELAGAMTDDAVTGTPGGASVFIEVSQGQKLGRLTVPNRVGWHRIELGLESGAPIELKVTTPRDGRRHHCINARVVERAHGSGRRESSSSMFGRGTHSRFLPLDAAPRSWSGRFDR